MKQESTVNTGSRFVRLLLSAMLWTFVAQAMWPCQLAAADWWNPAWKFRLPVTVTASGYERSDMPAEIQVNFTTAAASAGGSGTFIQNSIRVIEVNQTGSVVDTAVSFQFDPDAAYDPATHASGTLIVLLKGATGAAAERRYHVYFHTGSGSFVPYAVPDQVVFTDGILDEGQESFRFVTPGGTLFYHKQGAGFSSWVDAQGNDWISFNPTPGSGSAGEYRGIPNAVYPEGHFHPGMTTATSVLERDGPVKAMFRSSTTDGKWENRWEVFPKFSRLTMTTADHTYWFLYEGTPGGVFEPSTDFMVRSGGTQTFLSEVWVEDLAGIEWAYFSDPNTGAAGRSLFVVSHETDSHVDSYFPLNSSGNPGDGMTVFAFGRDYPATIAYINTVPRKFTMGIVDGTGLTTVVPVIDGSFRTLGIALGQAEQRALAAPALLAPADGASGLSSPVQLRWTRVEGAASYRLQIALDTSFAAPLRDDSTLTDTTSAVPGLQPGTLHYWRIRGSSSGVAGPYSPARRFSTALSVPSPVTPADGAAMVPVPSLFLWRTVQAAQFYRLQVATDSVFQSRVFDDSTLVDTTASVASLGEGIQYFWRVGARNALTTGGFSLSRRFTTVTPGPGLVSPVNGATGVPVTASFVWTRISGALTYHFQLGTDSLFGTGLVKNDSTITDSFRTVIGLNPATTYFWRVRALLAGGSTPYSAIWQFRTTEPVPETVVPVLPGPDAVVNADSVRLVWRRGTPGVLKYRIDVAADSLFQFGFSDSTGTDTSLIVRPLISGRTYWWRVRGQNAQGWGPYSEVRSFSVVITSVARTPESPTTFLLEQNYPNPFNPETRIVFSVPVEGQVRLEVFSLIGDRVAILVDGARSPGTYRVLFNGDRLASGVYLYRLSAPGVVLIRKMVLAR